MSAMRPCVVGIVGGIAVGKSTVASALCVDAVIAAELGGAVTVLDLDAVLRARRAAPGPLRDAIAALYPAAQRPDGSLDASLLAAAAFADSALMTALEALQWPVAVAALRAAITAATAQGVRALLVEGIALAEPPFASMLDALLLLHAAPQTRAARAVARGVHAEEFVARDAAGLRHLAAAERHASARIDATGALPDVVRAARGAILALCSSGGTRPNSPS